MNRRDAFYAKLAIGGTLANIVLLIALAAGHVPPEVLFGALLLVVVVPLCLPSDCLPQFARTRPVDAPRSAAAHPDWLERHIANVTRGE